LNRFCGGTDDAFVAPDEPPNKAEIEKHHGNHYANVQYLAHLTDVTPALSKLSISSRTFCRIAMRKGLQPLAN
jgi:hypothetical protein